MKKIILISALFVITSCSKEDSNNQIPNSSDLKSAIGLISLDNSDLIIENSAHYHSYSDKFTFDHTAKYKNYDVSGNILFNGIALAKMEKKFANSKTLNSNSTIGFEEVSKASLGNTIPIKITENSTLNNVTINTAIPKGLTINATYNNNNTIQLNWNSDENVNIDKIGFIFTYSPYFNGNGEDAPTISKLFRFKNSSGSGLINRSELSDIPNGSKVKLIGIRGSVNNHEKNGGTISIISYSFTDLSLEI